MSNFGTDDDMIRGGIISYLPDMALRPKRLVYAIRTINDMFDLLPDSATVDVIAQGYTDEDITELSGVRVHRHQTGIGQAAARNELLSDFYESDDDWLMYCDDDNYLSTRNNSTLLMYQLHTDPERFELLDCITSTNGMDGPFTKANSKLPLDNQFVFWPMPWFTMGEFKIIKNLRKYYGIEYYYDQRRLGEDTHFRLTCLSKLNSVQSRNLLTYPRSTKDGINTLGFETFSEQHAAYKDVGTALYKELNIPLKPNGKPDFRSLKSKIQYLNIDQQTGQVTHRVDRLEPIKLF